MNLKQEKIIINGIEYINKNYERENNSVDMR